MVKDGGMSVNDRIPKNSGENFGQNPFAALSSAGLPAASDGQPVGPGRGSAATRRNCGRVDILRQTAHRGGKTVTVAANFVGIGLMEKEKLAKAIPKACGTGGTVKEGLRYKETSARKSPAF